MNRLFDYAVTGGDLRQIYLVNALLKAGKTVVCAGLTHSALSPAARLVSSFAEAAARSETILCPIPLSKNGRDIQTMGASPDDATLEGLLSSLHPPHTLIGGAFPTFAANRLALAGIRSVDLMERDDVALLNAVATAEGCIALAIEKSAVNLHCSDALILGFGRCAQVLAKKLAGLDARVCVAARGERAPALAKALGLEAVALEDIGSHLARFDYVFNTIPAPVLGREQLLRTKPDGVILDIASAPGGIDFEAAKELGLDATLCPGLPGRYAPKTSGEILADTVLKLAEPVKA